jgi:hypothetical protein
MNLNNKRRTPYFTQLKDPKLDCPNKDCSGWLILFGIPGIPRPVPSFMQCSNKSHVDPSLRCSQPTIFSKRTSNCETCDKEIRVGDIITTTWDRKWVHIRCARRSVQPPDVFAVCLRCNLSIGTIHDSEPACIGGVDGYVHVGCTKRKRQEDAEDTDEEFPSSQDSLLLA